MTVNELAKALALVLAKPAPKAKAAPKRGNAAALAKARAVKAENDAARKAEKTAARKAKPAAESKPKAKKFAVGRKIEHGELVLVVQAPTKKRGRTYIAGFVGGEYVLGLRIDDPKLLARTIKAIDGESIAAAIELLAE